MEKDFIINWVEYVGKAARVLDSSDPAAGKIAWIELLFILGDKHA